MKIPAIWDGALMHLGVQKVFGRHMHNLRLNDQPARPRSHAHPRWLGAVVLLGVVLVCGATACGDDDSEEASTEPDATAATTEAAAEVDLAAQYCASVDDINAYAESLFAEIGEDASIEEQFEAERQVVVYIEEEGYDQMELPPEIDEDWHLFYEGFTMKLEAPTPEEPSLEAQAAEQRLLEWEEANCTS